ncbi:MAG: YlxR family protein [Eubacteriaceae bacterium]|nr:YlxR family protein [Eubacteriaceae bacterium]
MKNVPMRTCVICRKVSEKRDLLRIVRVPEGGMQVDPTGKMNGRGAYICRSGECLKNVKDMKKLANALSVQADNESLEELMQEIQIKLGKNNRQGE